MPFKVPTLTEVNRVVENGFSQAFYGTSGILRAMVLKVISKVVAGTVYMIALLASYIWKNEFVATADVEGLVRKGEIYGMPPKPASRARGKIIVAGTAGTSVPAGTVLIDDVNGYEYELLSAATIPSGSTSISVQVYSLGFGSQYNMDADATLSFRDAATGEFTFTVDSEGLYGGSCVDVTVDGVVRQWAESIEDYRSRLKIREKNQPMGGDVADYWLWAMSFSEVSDCFVVPNWPLTNSVSIYVANFNTPSIALNSIIVDEIRNYISSNDRRPATSEPVVATVAPKPCKFNVAIPVVNDFYKASVLTACKNFFKTLGPGQSFSIDMIRQAIVDNGGVDECRVTMLYFDNVYRSDGLVTLYRSYSTPPLSIFGEVVDIYSLDSLVTFTNLA